MTISRDALGRLSDHWAIQAAGVEKLQLASSLAVELHVQANLGEQMASTEDIPAGAEQVIRDAAFVFEIVASEGLDEPSHGGATEYGDNSGIAEAAAHEAFGLLRSLPLRTGSTEELLRQVLQLGALAYCSDRWAEFRTWMRERNITPERFVPSSDRWDARVIADLGQVWTRLLRKDGWADLEGVSSTVARLREEQRESEEQLFARQESAESAQASGWRLVALYHWARISEVVATYLMQGEPISITTELDFHFDRAVAAAQQSGDPEFVVVLRWQRAMSLRMVAGALWSITRIGPEIRAVVADATRHRSMFEMLPPQRVAIQEQGLLDPASAAVVVDLPTSAGKTILAEFKIVQAVSQFKQDHGWVAYVAPTRALVAQIARRLRRDLGASGIRVEELTAAVEIDDVESAMLSEPTFDVLVATPEKLNLAIRNGSIERPLALLILDEAHNIEDEDRGIRIELLLATVKRDCPQANFLLMMPFVPNADDLARWLSPQTGKSISLASTPWQPNDRVIGLVTADAPPGGRGRNWSLAFESMLTTGSSLPVNAKYVVGSGPQFDRTYSSFKNDLGRLAGAAASTFSERGTAIVVCPTIQSVWNIASEISDKFADVEDDDIEMVQRFLATEVSADYALINLLRRRVGVHHAGLSDETRALMEWLAERGKLRVLVATTGLSQGLNFPVSSIFLASRNLPSQGFTREMTHREFWNLAGRAGRVDQDSIGVVGLSCKPGERGALVEFLSTQAGDLVSRMVSLLNELEDAGRLLDLDRAIHEDQWADYRNYVAHLFAQKKNLDAVLAETELLLRNTFGYVSLADAAPAQRDKGVRLLEATRRYAQELAQNVETTTLADSTGFTPEGIKRAMAGMRQMDTRMRAEDWQPESIFGDTSSSALPDLMKVMLQLPQIRKSIEELSGIGDGAGDRGARIAADWVAGVSVSEIANRYFGESADPTAALTSATRAIYRNLAMAGTWGISALSKLPTSGIDYDEIPEDDLRSINLLGAMLYHGVNTEAGVVMRMSSVPRVAANSLGRTFMTGRPREEVRPANARSFLTSLSDRDWSNHLPDDARLTGADLRRVWQVLSGALETAPADGS